MDTLPAVELLVKLICASLRRKVWVTPELLVMPVPLRVSVRPELTVMKYGFVAAGVKMMPLTSVSSEIETAVVLERPNVAVSAAPLGTPFGVHLAAVFQSPEIGSRSHWALIAYVTVGMANIREQRIAARMSVFIDVISGICYRR
jgi:hypothetical protein